MRANNADEFTALSATIFAIVEAVNEIEVAVRGANAAVPPQPQAATIAAQFGGAIISEQPSATPGLGTRTCPHGTMTRIHGLTGKFGPYKGHFCPAKMGDPTKCQPSNIYVKQNSPEWNSFIPDQTKA